MSTQPTAAAASTALGGRGVLGPEPGAEGQGVNGPPLDLGGFLSPVAHQLFVLSQIL